MKWGKARKVLAVSIIVYAVGAAISLYYTLPYLYAGVALPLVIAYLVSVYVDAKEFENQCRTGKCLAKDTLVIKS